MIYKEHSQTSNFEILNNIYLHGFEADIVIRKMSLVDGKEMMAVLNIELDGPKHSYPTKRHFCKLRDEFLTREYGILIKRLELKGNQDSQDSDIRNAIKSFKKS